MANMNTYGLDTPEEFELSANIQEQKRVPAAIAQGTLQIDRVTCKTCLRILKQENDNYPEC